MSGTGGRREDEGDDLDEVAERLGLEGRRPEVSSGDPLWAGRPADAEPGEAPAWRPPGEESGEAPAGRPPGEGSGEAPPRRPPGERPASSGPAAPTRAETPTPDATAGWLPPTDAPPPAASPAAAGSAPWPGQAASGAPAAAGGTPAEWLPRAGAAAVDFLVRLAIIVAFVLLGAITFVAGESAGRAGVLAGALTGAVLAGLVYAPYMLATRDGQTIGHRVTGTRVVMADGSRLDGGRAFLREVLVKALLFEGIGGFLFGIPTIVNYAWPLFDRRKEALHDKLCRTRVVEA